jgi:hypothetical protein
MLDALRVSLIGLPAHVEPTGVSIHGKPTTIQLEKIARILFSASSHSTQFYNVSLGQMYSAAENAYGVKIGVIRTVFGPTNVQRAKNCAYVVRRWEGRFEVHENLNWNFYAKTASLPKKTQEKFIAQRKVRLLTNEMIDEELSKERAKRKPGGALKTETSKSLYEVLAKEFGEAYMLDALRQVRDRFETEEE